MCQKIQEPDVRISVNEAGRCVLEVYEDGEKVFDGVITRAVIRESNRVRSGCLTAVESR